METKYKVGEKALDAAAALTADAEDDAMRRYVSFPRTALVAQCPCRCCYCPLISSANPLGRPLLCSCCRYKESLGITAGGVGGQLKVVVHNLTITPDDGHAAIVIPLSTPGEIEEAGKLKLQVKQGVGFTMRYVAASCTCRVRLASNAPDLHANLLAASSTPCRVTQCLAFVLCTR